MISLFFFMAVLLSCATVVLWKRDIDIVKCGALGISFYFIGYIFSTAALFFVEQFSLKRATFATLCVFLGVFTFSSYKTRSDGQVQLTLALREFGISYLIILILLITFAGSFGFFGMGQDQGVYQCEAINIINGQNKWRTSVDEYKTIEDEEYKEYYRESVQKVLGYKYVEEQYYDIMTPPDFDGLEGVYHGLPTFPAVLALAGSMFGIEHMMIFQIVFYAISLLLIDFILQKQSVGRWMRGVLVTVFGVSPEVIWVSKSSLTEGFLAVLFLLYLFFITGLEFRQHVLSILPVLALCFWHISAFSVFPFFIINYWVLYFYNNRDRKYLFITTSIIIGLLLSLVINGSISTIYVINNIEKLLFQRNIYIDRFQLFVALLAIAGVCIILNEGMRLFGKNNTRSLFIMERILTIVLVVASILDFAYGDAYWGYTSFPELIGRATITAYATLSGFWLMPILLVVLIATIKREKPIAFYILLNGFLYLVLIYSMILRRRVIHYYYYSRYIMPYIPIIILLFGIMYVCINNNSSVWNRVIKVLFVIIPIIGVIMMLPYTLVVKNNQDDTNIQWNTLASLLNRVNKGDVVFLDEDEMMVLYHPFKSKGAYVYPVFKDVSKTIEKSGIVLSGRNVYYLSESEYYEGEGRFGVAYKDKSQYQLDDMGSERDIILWPTDFTVKGEKNYILYKIFDDEPTVSGSDGCFMYGWTENSSGFRWMNDEVSAFFTHLDKDNYDMLVVLGNVIPFEMISIDEISLDIYVNDNYIDNLVITSGMQEFVVGIPKEFINEGKNTISFTTRDRWSPSEYGSADPSKYAISVDFIKFRKVIQ